MLIGSAAKAQDCFARIELNKRTVYVQQPFRITVRVLTKTWYTAPLDFDNIQIPNSFILPFDRTFSSMFTVGNVQYAGLEFYYIVFPYKAGTFTIPPIHIVATTPPEGSSESRKVTLTTAPQKIIVKDVPPSLKKESWFVAKDVSISESWNKPMNNIKVGDVITRTITINAKGTLPQFIPEIAKEKPAWASIYPDEAELDDTRDENDANGRRIESITYLLEKAGKYQVPQIKVTWWNPNNSRIYSKITAPLSINIKENPNLGILTTLKDSLQAQQKNQPQNKAEKKTFLVLGIPWYWFTLYALTAISILYILIRLTIRMVKWLLLKRRHYLQSEYYSFLKFMRLPINSNKLIAALYNWWDKSKIVNRSPSVMATFKKENENEMIDELQNIYGHKYKNGDSSLVNTEEKKFKSNIKKYRNDKHDLSNEKTANISSDQQLWNI